MAEIKDKLITSESLKYVNDKLNADKLDKQQGVENKGKILEIGEDGNVQPQLKPKTLPNPQKLTFNGAVTAEYDGSGAVTVTIPETNQIERIEKLDHDIAVELIPNKLYVFPEMSELTITLGAISNAEITNEYHFIFKSGTTPTVLSIPESVNVSSNFSVLKNMIYEISIMENCMVYQSWEGSV